MKFFLQACLFVIIRPQEQCFKLKEESMAISTANGFVTAGTTFADLIVDSATDSTWYKIWDQDTMTYVTDGALDVQNGWVSAASLASMTVDLTGDDGQYYIKSYGSTSGMSDWIDFTISTASVDSYVVFGNVELEEASAITYDQLIDTSNLSAGSQLRVWNAETNTYLGAEDGGDGWVTAAELADYAVVIGDEGSTMDIWVDVFKSGTGRSGWENFTITAEPANLPDPDVPVTEGETLTLTAATETEITTTEANATKTVTYWDNDLTDAESNGVPLADLLSFVQSYAGLDFVQLGLINVASGTDDGDNNGDLGDVDDPASSIESIDDVSGFTFVANDDGTQTIRITGDDGAVAEAEVSISDEYFTFINDLLFDADGNSRLYEETVSVYEALTDADGNEMLDINGDKIPVEVVVETEGETTTTDVPLVLTTTQNNGSTLEEGLTTTDYDDTIVAGTLELLHGAYIDGGEGNDTLEIEAKGYFAQPAELINIENVVIENVPNIYTTENSTTTTTTETNDTALTDPDADDVVTTETTVLNGTTTTIETTVTTTGTTIVTTTTTGTTVDSIYPDLVTADVVQATSSIIDLTNARDIESLTITEGAFEGLIYNEEPGTLTVAGIRNGAETTLDGEFTQSVTLNYSDSVGDGIDLVLSNVNMAGDLTQLVIAQNSDTLNIESTGGGNWIHNANLGGELTELNITGDAHLYIEGDLDASFHDGTPVTIDASANTAGVDLTLTATTTGTGTTADPFITTGSEQVTFLGSSADDRFVVTTTDHADSIANDQSVTIDAGAGNDYFVVDTDTATITLNDGNNNVELTATDATITAGTGANVLEGTVAEAFTAELGDGDNTVDVTAETFTLTVGDGDNNIVANTADAAGDDLVSETVTITTGDGDNTIVARAEEIAVTTGDGNDSVIIGGTNDEVANDSALLTIDLGAGDNVLRIAHDDDVATVNTALIALDGSSITGENITLYVDQPTDLSQATLEGITSIVLDANVTDADPTDILTLTAEQFSTLGADVFSVNGSAFGKIGELEIIIDQDTTLSELVDLDQLSSAINLNLVVNDGVTLTMTAEELHKYVANDGISQGEPNNTDEAPGKVVITDAGLDFDAFDVALTGSVAGEFAASNVTVVRDLDGFERPADVANSDTLVINSDDTPVVDTAIESDVLATLIVEGTADITFEDAINLGDNFTVDFSALEGTATDLTIADFEDMTAAQEVVITTAVTVSGTTTTTTETVPYTGQTAGTTTDGDTTTTIAEPTDAEDLWGAIIGNGDARVNVEVTEGTTVGSDAQGISVSGVSTLMVTDVTATTTADDSATIYLCDTASDVKTIGLQGNWDTDVTFENVAWDVDILLEAATTLKTGTLDVGSLTVNYYDDALTTLRDIYADDVVVTINNQGVATTEDIWVESLELNDASSVTINAADGDVNIAALGGSDIANLYFNSESNIMAKIATTDTLSDLEILNATGVVGDFTLALATATYDFSDAALSGIDAIDLDTTLTLNADQVVEFGSVIADADTTTSLLNVVDLADQALDLSAIDVYSIGTVTIADIDGTVTLNAATDFGDATSVIIDATDTDTTVEMTAAQFETIHAQTVTVLETANTTDATLVLTDLANDATIDLTNVSDADVVLRATDITATADFEVTGGTATLEVVGTVDMSEATLGIDNTDPADGDFVDPIDVNNNATADFFGITAVSLAEGAVLTLTAAQVEAIGITDTDNDDVADAWSALAGATLNITDLSDQSLDLDLIQAAGINIGTVTIENTDAAIAIDADTTFGGADEIVTPTADMASPEWGNEQTAITMTVDQFHSSAGVISGDSQVNLTGLYNNVDTDGDFIPDAADFDFSEIANAGTITFAADTISYVDPQTGEAIDKYVTLTDTASLGDFELQLRHGQMIRFATEDQAGIKITVIATPDDFYAENDDAVTIAESVTGVQWLWTTFTSEVDTAENYDGNITSLFIDEALLVSQPVEEDLWSELAGTITVEKINGDTIPELVKYNRVNTLEALTNIAEGINYDDDADFSTVANLIINLEGEVNLGDILVGDTNNGNGSTPGIDGEGYFDSLTINSYLDTSTIEDYVGGNANENGIVLETNTIGDISLNADSVDDLVDVTISTADYNDLENVNGAAATRDGMAIETGTITFASAEAQDATLTLTGAEDITIEGIDISDDEISVLTIDATGMGLDGDATDDTTLTIGGEDMEDYLADLDTITMLDSHTSPSEGTADSFGTAETATTGHDLLVITDGDNDLTAATLDIEAVHVSGDATITLTADQVANIGILDTDADGVFADNWTVAAGANVTLNITDLGDQVLNLNAIEAAGFNIGEVSTVEDTTAVVETVLDAGTTLGGADQLTILMNDQNNSLTLTAEQYQQINAGNIVEQDNDLVTATNKANVTVTDLDGIATDTGSDTIVDTVNIDLSTVLATGALRLEVADADSTVTDITVDDTSDLGAFTVVLSSLGDEDSLAGQTIRFSTAAQAERAIDVLVSGDKDAEENAVSKDNGTNVVWLFDTIEGTLTAGKVDTDDYDAALERVWMTETLVADENVEELFTNLDGSIIIRVVNDEDLQTILPTTTGYERTVEIETYSTEIGDLTFSDIDEDAAETFNFVQNLTIDLGGAVEMGDVTVSNILSPAAAGDDEFDTLTINSLMPVWVDTNTNNIVDDGDSLTEGGYLLPKDETFGDKAGVLPLPDADSVNIVGDLKSGSDAFDLANVTLDTGVEDDLGDDLNELEIGTITFSDDDADSDATLTVTGTGDVEITSVNTDDADITTLTVNVTGFTGTLTAPGASPALQLDATEELVFDNEDVAAGTITLGSDVNAGVSGDELSTINASGFDGTLNLGTLSMIDGTDDDTDDDGIAEQAAFTFTAGSGVTTLTLGEANGEVPTLEDDSNWVLNLAAAADDSSLTITDDVVFGAGNLAIALGSNGVDLIFEGEDLDLSDLETLTISGTGTITVDPDADLDLSEIENLTIPTTTTITVAEGAVLTLTAAQANGMTITGAGTVEILDLEDTPLADLSKIMTTVTAGNVVGDTGIVNAYLDTADDDDDDTDAETIQLDAAKMGVANIEVDGDGTVEFINDFAGYDRDNDGNPVDGTPDDYASVTVKEDATVELTAAQANGLVVDGAGTVEVADLGLDLTADLSNITATTVNAAFNTDGTFTGDFGTAVVTLGTDADLTANISVLDGATIGYDHSENGATPAVTASVIVTGAATEAEAIDADLSGITVRAIEIKSGNFGTITFPVLTTDTITNTLTTDDNPYYQSVEFNSAAMADGQTITGEGSVSIESIDSGITDFDLSGITVTDKDDDETAAWDDADNLVFHVNYDLTLAATANFGDFDIQMDQDKILTLTGAQADGLDITDGANSAYVVLKDVSGDIDLSGIVVSGGVTASITDSGDVDLSGIAGFTDIDVATGADADLTLDVSQFAALDSATDADSIEADLVQLSSLTADVEYTLIGASEPTAADLTITATAFDAVTGYATGITVEGAAFGIVEAAKTASFKDLVLVESSSPFTAITIEHTGIGGVASAETSAEGFAGSTDHFIYAGSSDYSTAITSFTSADGDKVNLEVFGDGDDSVTNLDLAPASETIVADNVYFATAATDIADSVSAALSTFITATTAWTEAVADTTAYFVIADTDTTGIYEYTQKGVADTVIAQDELQLIGTVDATMAITDIVA